MFGSGLVVCLGMMVWFAKCGWRMRLRLLSFPLFVDLIVFLFLTIIHWGTFSGVMAATAGALMVSLLLSLGRKMFGHMRNGDYVRGWLDVSTKVN